MLILNLIHKKLNAMKILVEKNIKTIFLAVLLIKLFVLIIDLLNQPLYGEVKMQLLNLVK